MSSIFKEKVDVNEKMEEARCYLTKYRGGRGVCLRRLGFVLPNAVCSIFNFWLISRKFRN